MKKIILMLGVFLFSTSCDKNDENSLGYPNCFQRYIDIYLRNYPQPPIGSTIRRPTIKKYMYYDNEVFLVDFLPHAPDSQMVVASCDCNSICDLGGIDGDQNDCEDWGSAEYIETVWTDTR